jgi:hypothetical protein
MVPITVTREERRLIERAAEAARLPPATWMRMVVLQAAERRNE